MKNDNLRKALETNRFYYAQICESMRPEHERIRIEQKRILSGVYREVAEMEARLRAIEEEFGYKYTHYMPSYPSKDDDGGGDDSGGDSGDNGGDAGGNSGNGDDSAGNDGDHYDPDEPRIPAGQPGGGQWTSGGSGQVMDDAGNLYPLDNSSLAKPDGIPDDWMTNPANKGIGTKYTDPNNKGNEVRVMQGDPNSDFSVQQEPYVRWMNNGQWLDVNGNITTSKADAHIPLEDFEFMPEIFP